MTKHLDLGAVAQSTAELLPIKFYARGTVLVAKELLGKVLRVRDGVIWRSGIIVEDEAYLRDDAACHAYRGPNVRNQSMFKGAGTVYVFVLHGVHCVNAVTQGGEGILIRALEPLENVSLPTNGPGKLCRAMNITRDTHDGMSFASSQIQIVDQHIPWFEVGVSPRVGIYKSKELLLRFYIKNNMFVSK